MAKTDQEKRNELLLWLKALSDTNNEAFMPLFFNEKRYIVLMGGGGSGKSRFAARKLVERATTEPKSRYLVCRKVARTLKESCLALLCEIISAYYSDCGANISRAEPRITFLNGSEIIFAGIDDSEKLKSIHGITSIWIEEASELTESDFNQLDVRLRGIESGYKQIILSFNPISANHWLKKRFFDKKDERAIISHTTYKDNRFLDAENVKTLEAFKDSDSYYYSVYAKGMWGSTGRGIFNNSEIAKRLCELKDDYKCGGMKYDYDGLSIKNISFGEYADGEIKIYEEPLKNVPYVIGADTAGTGSDYYAAHVINNITGFEAASFHVQSFTEDSFAHSLYSLGKYYNTALIAVECNFSSYTVMELDRLRYPKQYIRDNPERYDGRIGNMYGFRTDALTRPLIISNLVRIMREGGLSLISDKETLLEMSTFIRNDELRAQAENGTHDDLVMSLAISYYARAQQRTSAENEAAGFSGWSEDMLEDYKNADAQGKEYLLKKWKGKIT